MQKSATPFDTFSIFDALLHSIILDFAYQLPLSTTLSILSQTFSSFGTLSPSFSGFLILDQLLAHYLMFWHTISCFGTLSQLLALLSHILAPLSPTFYFLLFRILAQLLAHYLNFWHYFLMFWHYFLMFWHFRHSFSYFHNI